MRLEKRKKSIIILGSNPNILAVGIPIRIYGTHRCIYDESKDVNKNVYYEGIIIKYEDFCTNYSWHFWYNENKSYYYGEITYYENKIRDFFITRKLSAMRYIKILSSQTKINL